MDQPNLTAKQRLEQRQALLDSYESSIGLPSNDMPGNTTELQAYLSMDRDTIEHLSVSRACAICTRLAQFSMYFNRCYNREVGIKIWADEQLNNIVAQHIGSYDKYLKTDIKIAMICQENVAAKELKSIVNYASQRINRLNEISSGIKNLSYVLSLIIRAKHGERNVERE